MVIMRKLKCLDINDDKDIYNENEIPLRSLSPMNINAFESFPPSDDSNIFFPMQVDEKLGSKLIRMETKRSIKKEATITPIRKVYTKSLFAIDKHFN